MNLWTCQRTLWGVEKKEGGGKPHEGHPSRERVFDPPSSENVFHPPQVSGVEKLTQSILKGVSNRALFAYENGRFASSFLLLGVGVGEASKNADLSFKGPPRNPIQTRPGHFLHSQRCHCSIIPVQNLTIEETGKKLFGSAPDIFGKVRSLFSSPHTFFFGKIPTPIKKNWHLHPPFQKTPTPPLNCGILWAGEFSSRKNQKMPGAHKIGGAISGPRIAGGKDYGHEDFSDIHWHRPFFPHCMAFLEKGGGTGTGIRFSFPCSPPRHIIGPACLAPRGGEQLLCEVFGEFR